MKCYQLELFADYFQFYFQDDNTDFGDLSNAWTDSAVTKLLAVSERVVGVGTVRNVDVPVTVTIDSRLPEPDESDWDKINRTTIFIESGRIVFAGCTDYFPDAKRIDVSPGMYDVVIAYRNLDSISEDGLDGDDSYHVYLSET